MSAVVDGSVVVAALVDDGPTGRWAEEVLLAAPLAAPHLMPAEVSNVLRRAEASGRVSGDVAALAHGDLLDLRVDLHEFAPFGARVRELRATVTAYDAWYVALAEALDAPLATLDTRLRRAPGPRCRWLTPPH